MHTVYCEKDAKGIGLRRWIYIRPEAVVCGLVVLCGMMGLSRQAHGFSYLFAKAHGEDIVSHAGGYTGSQDQLFVTVGIDPGSLYIDDLMMMTQNVVRTWNRQTPVTGNQSSGVGFGEQMFDLESILLHEMGHAVGMDHPNQGIEAGIPASKQGLAMSTFGPNGFYEFVDEKSPEYLGIKDGLLGSFDDIRGDDVNLNYFNKETNNPFMIAGVVDSGTYSRELSDLPLGHDYSAVGSGSVALSGGSVNSQAVMHQVFSPGAIQRDLSFDDVAGVSYAQTGLDHLADTGDDYQVTLIYGGVDVGADIVIDYGDHGLDFGVLANTLTEGGFIPGTSEGQVMIQSAEVQLSDAANWYFNTASNAAVPTAVYGDFNNDLVVDALDVELLSFAIDGGGEDLIYDLTGEGVLDFRDSYQLVRGTIDALAADFNLDGQVDVQDLSAWATGFGSSSSFTQGDANLDGQVDVQDLSMWATGFGRTGGNTSGLTVDFVSVSSAVAIPEPGGLALLLGLGGLMFVRRGGRL